MAVSRKPAKEEYISPNKAAVIAGVTGEAVKQWIYARKLPASKLPNGYWRIRLADLHEHLKARKGPGLRRVLLASSDEQLARRAERACAELGYRFASAANRLDALLKAKDTRPSAILIDLADPGVEGVSLAHSLRTTRGFRRLPFILVSTRETLKDLTQAEVLRTSAQGLLHKPVSARALKDELRKLFG
jgi:CheY-like chemotaxis protein